MAGILQAKKAGYPLDMEGFWLSDKFRIRAVTFYWRYVHVDRYERNLYGKVTTWRIKYILATQVSEAARKVRAAPCGFIPYGKGTKPAPHLGRLPFFWKTDPAGLPRKEPKLPGLPRNSAIPVLQGSLVFEPLPVKILQALPDS
jgi:hypothetical protein